ncbi:hypothetical protein R6Q57_002764 [Mikania cordata]
MRRISDDMSSLKPNIKKLILFHRTKAKRRRFIKENITDELNKAKSTTGGDDTPVDEVEVLQRSLGERRGHVRGVGRKVKSITPDLPPHIYAHAANELQQQLAEAMLDGRSNNASTR